MSRRKLLRAFCRNCFKSLNRRNKIYCHNKCQWTYINLERFRKGTLSARAIKKILLIEKGHKCEICKIETWLGEKIPLILDHINGNSENNKRENLRLVCGNCDMLLPTYKNKNKGKGRKYRRDRYALGKSY